MGSLTVPYGGGSCGGCCKVGSIGKLECEARNKGWMGPESRRGKICHIMWSGEKVLNGVRNISAVRAVWQRGSVHGMEVILRSKTVAAWSWKIIVL